MSRAYRYYDSPDGYDLFHKTEYITRRVGIWSSSLAIADVMCVTQPKTYFAIAERFARVFFPPIIAGGIFTTTVYIATNIRKKDDSWNHVLGGILSTCYINKIFKNTPVVWCIACPLLITLCIYKDMKMMENSTFNPDFTDSLMDIGGPAIEYDLKRKSIYADKKNFIYSDWFN